MNYFHVYNFSKFSNFSKPFIVFYIETVLTARVHTESVGQRGSLGESCWLLGGRRALEKLGKTKEKLGKKKDFIVFRRCFLDFLIFCGFPDF